MQETQETWVLSLSWEDSLEKERASHSGILAWRIPWTEEPGGLQSMGLQRVGCDLTNTQLCLSFPHVLVLITLISAVTLMLSSTFS